MAPFTRLRTRLRRLLHDPGLPVYYAPQYRLPITGLEANRGLEPRRADLAAWALLAVGAVVEEQLRSPPKISYRDLCRVHDPDLLESLTTPEVLARVFAVEPWDVPVDEVVHSYRLAVGGTLAAARVALRREGPAVNLLGGFHHAGPDSAGGLCPVNDMAVAIATLRSEGFDGQVVVIDLDAHPADGTAACLADDAQAFIGSISGVDWGELPGMVRRFVLPGADDTVYLDALEALLADMPRPDLAFVVAGGDVLATDRMGNLGLTPAGVRQRDLRVAAALAGRPSVWLPGGGYSAQAWRLLAGTVMALALGREVELPPGADPLSERFADVARRLDPARLRGEDDADAPWITEEDLADVLGLPGKRTHRLLGYYTAAGIEYGLYRYGILGQVRRLGYTDLRAEVDAVPLGDRMRLYGTAEGTEHLLYEAVYEKQRVTPPPGVDSVARPEVLFVHWLTLRHPRGSFSDSRPRLPGQDVPGAGLAREAGEVLGRMAERLGLSGVALRPAWFHVAYAARYRFRFVDPGRQGRFEALLRDLGHVSLLDLTHAVADGRVRLNGTPYTWEADLMVAWLGKPPWTELAYQVAAARDAARFTIEP